MLKFSLTFHFASRSEVQPRRRSAIEPNLSHSVSCPVDGLAQITPFAKSGSQIIVAGRTGLQQTSSDGPGCYGAAGFGCHPFGPLHRRMITGANPNWHVCASRYDAVPIGIVFACSRRTNFWIFPVEVLGMAVNTKRPGTL